MDAGPLIPLLTLLMSSPAVRKCIFGDSVCWGGQGTPAVPRWWCSNVTTEKVQSHREVKDLRTAVLHCVARGGSWEKPHTS